MNVREIKKIIEADGWVYKNSRGYDHYIHPTKSGKVTIPNHRGDLDIRTAKSILQQAGLR